MLEIGSLLDGKYKILNKIGQGGMSIVYLAMNEKANKQWAVKEMRKEKNENYDFVKQSLIMETNLLKELKHPYLPSIADIIENEDTILIVMDYIEGRPLSDILAENGPLPQEEVVEYALQICDVFDYMHSQSPPIIYRDLKPANIMLKPDGKITLIDFGTARKYNYNSNSDTTCLGTVGYAAPEQFAGDDNRQTDARTDIYNLGATMYHLVTGQNPSEPPYELYPIRRWDDRLSTGLEKIILKATQKDPKERFADCNELANALRHFRDLDDSYIRMQKMKLLLFAVSIIISFSGFATAGFAKSMENRAVSEIYNSYLSQAALTVALQENDSQIDRNVLKMYQDAINVSPESSEAYIRLLDYYLDKGTGQTGNGLMAVSAMIASGKGNLKKNDDVMMKMGQIYFSGNAKDDEFLPNYAAAAEYFSMVSGKKYPQAKYYSSLARSLSEIGTDWESIVEDMKSVDEYLAAGANETEKIEAYTTLSKIYRANAFGIQKTGEKPYDRAMELLNRVNEILSSSYIDKEIVSEYQPEVFLGLADSYYRRANTNIESKEAADDLYEAISYYEQYLIFASDTQTVLFKNRIGDIYRTLGDYDRADEVYGAVTEEFPNDATAYISRATMKLIDLKDVDEALKLFNQAGTLENIDSNSNYISLKNKLQNLGVL